MRGWGSLPQVLPSVTIRNHFAFFTAQLSLFSHTVSSARTFTSETAPRTAGLSKALLKGGRKDAARAALRVPQLCAGGDRFCSAPLPGRCRRSENPQARNHPPECSGAGSAATPGAFVLCGGAPRAAARPVSRLPRPLPAAAGEGGGGQLPTTLSHPPPLWGMPPTYEQPGEPPAPDHGGRCSASSPGGARPPPVPAELSGAQRAAVRPWDVPVPAARLGTAAAARGRLGSSHRLSKRGKKKKWYLKKKRSNLSRLRCEARPPTADSFNGAWQPQVQVARRGGDSAARAPHAAAHHTRSSAAPSRRLRAGSPGPRAPPGCASAPRRASRPPEGGPLLARERSLSSARRSGAHPSQPRGRQTMWSPQDHPASFLFTWGPQETSACALKSQNTSNVLWTSLMAVGATYRARPVWPRRMEGLQPTQIWI